MKKQTSFVEIAQRIPHMGNGGILDYGPEKSMNPTLQVGLPNNQEKWIQRENIGGILSNAFTSTARK